jgi:hypothetical protein
MPPVFIHYLPAASAIFNFAGHLLSETFNISLTDSRRMKPGGGSITLYQSPGKLFNFGLFY